MSSAVLSGWGDAESVDAARLIQLALAEDLPDGDRTSDYLFPAVDSTFPDGTGRGPSTLRARGVVRAAGVVCGLPVLEAVFAAVDPLVSFVSLRGDGESAQSGDAVFEVAGPAASVLRAERTVLNFFGRLCGVSSLTARWVEALRGTSVALLDTRKTTPGWRRLEKYAVRVGGGSNHRMDLSDGILVKDNHRELLRGEGVESTSTWIAGLRQANPGIFLQVEVDTRDEFLAVLACDVDSILLDNFSLEALRWAVETNRQLAGRTTPQKRLLLEASGGIRLEDVREVAETGVDRISVGALTHAAVSLDVSLETVAVE